MKTVQNSTQKQVVCKHCRHYARVEERNFCNKFQAFLADSILDIPCDLLEAKK